MLSFFKHHTTDSSVNQPLLTQSELQQLRTWAEQIDCSSRPSVHLNSQQACWLTSKPLGSGMDYAESRVYQHGDDPRYINWRLSARSQETFVKTFHIESRPSLCILLDLRTPMRFGTRNRLKSSQAIRVACLLAYAAEHKQVAIQTVVIKGNNIQWFNDISVDSFINLINQPFSTSLKESLKTPQADLQTIFEHLNQKVAGNNIAKGSLIYLISDFHDLNESDVTFLVHFQEQHFVQAISILDQSELQLPKIGVIHLQSMNDESYQMRYSINTNTAKENRSFSEYANKQLQKHKKLVTETGMAYTSLLTSEENIHQQISIPLGHA
jgi:hypothetical protein